MKIICALCKGVIRDDHHGDTVTAPLVHKGICPACYRSEFEKTPDPSEKVRCSCCEREFSRSEIGETDNGPQCSACCTEWGRRLHCFTRYGCRGFWREEYARMPLDQLVPALIVLCRPQLTRTIKRLKALNPSLFQ